ncbi:MAG: hypothetical protein HQ594_04805 [Candidatus Omnitrophica bacterium]|nr:hypothetical protein [Candidatus Omnitrophota bacterium]
MKKVILLTFLLAALFWQTEALFAAVGCTLNDPDRDIKRIFPQASRYKTEFVTIKEKGGEELAGVIEDKLGEKLEPVYETIDVPYAQYTVLKGKETIGYVHGVNQKGTFGGMQIILATDADGKIIDFYYQKISSPEAKKFRDKSFTNQFKGLTLKDFYLSEQSPVLEIEDPSDNNKDDFKATLRGIKKNLILLDTFKLNDKNDQYWEQGKGEGK